MGRQVFEGSYRYKVNFLLLLQEAEFVQDIVLINLVL